MRSVNEQENLNPNISRYAESILLNADAPLSKVIDLFGLFAQAQELRDAGWFPNTSSSVQNISEESTIDVSQGIAKIALSNLLKGIKAEDPASNTVRVLLALEFFHKALPRSMSPNFNIFAHETMREFFRGSELSNRSAIIKTILSSNVGYLIESDYIGILEGVLDLPHMTHDESKKFIDRIIYSGYLTNVTPTFQAMLVKLVSKLKESEEAELMDVALKDGLEPIAIAIVDHKAKNIDFVNMHIDQAIFIINTAVKSSSAETKSRILDALNAAAIHAPFSTFQSDHQLLLSLIKFSNSTRVYNTKFFQAFDKFELGDEILALYEDPKLSEEDRASVKKFYNSYISIYHDTNIAQYMSRFVNEVLDTGLEGVRIEEKDIERYASRVDKLLAILDFDTIHAFKKLDKEENSFDICVLFFVKAGDMVVLDPKMAPYIKGFMKSIDSIRTDRAPQEVKVEAANEQQVERQQSMFSKFVSNLVGSSAVER